MQLSLLKVGSRRGHTTVSRGEGSKRVKGIKRWNNKRAEGHCILWVMRDRDLFGNRAKRTREEKMMKGIRQKMGRFLAEQDL